MPENPLLRWTVEAKRALQQAEQLSSHASGLVSQSSDSFNHAVELFPKCIFLKEALRAQINLLEKLGGSCYTVEQQARHEFEVFIKELDTLDIDLNEILSRLRSMALDPGFDEINLLELRQNPPRKSLHDFVDEHGIEELKAQLRQAIDEVQDSHDILSSSLSTLSTEIKDLKTLVETIQLPQPLPTITSSSSDSVSRSKTYSTHAEKQDYHAHHLASLLTSLAQHYDQTASALKEHESPLGQVSSIDSETLEILSKDAKEVHEVLEEMEDHVREIEHSSDIIQTHAKNVNEIYQNITNIFTQLETVRHFETRASVNRQHIQTLKQEMFNLVEYYTHFSTAYEALLIEVRRRTEAQSHTSLLVNEISAKLAGLYEQEVRHRQAFMDLHAAYLPEDLWTGIYDPPARSAVITEEGGVLPLLKEGKRLSLVEMERRRSGQQTPLRDSADSGGKRSTDSSRRSLETRR